LSDPSAILTATRDGDEIRQAATDTAKYWREMYYDLIKRADAGEFVAPDSDGKCPLRWAVETVLETFRKDEAQGYRSRDRQYAISILGKALHGVAQAEALPDLTDPVVVHANMLRGTIAKPTWEQIKHLYPEQFPDAAATPSNTALPSREAIARVIFPNAFLDEHEKSPPIRIWTQAMQEAAFETADAILALFAVPSEQ
jgi:hypothetical protein